MSTIGISNSGENEELEFRLLTGAQPTKKSSLGDAVFEGEFVEIKKASSDTINQVRAVKFITLAIKNSKQDCWYVVPAHQVVNLVSKKKRGQHTENPFESSTLSLKKLEDWRVPIKSDLASHVRDAIQESRNFQILEVAMKKILEGSQQLANQSLDEVKDLLTQLGLE